MSRCCDRLLDAPAKRFAGALVLALSLTHASIVEARLGPPEADVAPDEPASSEPASSEPASSTTEAQADERVLIRVVPADDQVSARLRAELGLLGFTAIALEVPEQTPTFGPDLLDQLDARNASAAIEIVIAEHRIDLWVADGNTGKALNRRLDLTNDAEQADPRTIAISAVELLRASRLELGEAPPERESTQVLDPNELAEQARERERPSSYLDLPSDGAISLAPMVGGSPGGFGVTTHVELAGRWAPLERFALRASLWIPALGNGIAVTDGYVRMFVGMVFIEPQLRLPGGVEWFHPELGLGLGGAVVGFEGNAREGLRSDTRVLGGFASYGHLGLGFAVVPRVWIRLDGYVGMLLPRPVLKSSAGQTEATWGAPFGTGTLGLEIWL